MPDRTGRILIIDDDKDILVAGRLLLKRRFKTVVTANRPEHIPKLLADSCFDAILLDMNFAIGDSTGREGFRWLSRILEIDPDAVVILITAYGHVELAVEAMKKGATDFISKPWQNEKLVATLSAAVRLRQTKDEATTLRRRNRELAAHTMGSGQEILGESTAILEALSLVARAAPTDANVLILGENGTGKELIARELHRQSMRRGEIFMSVDLGAIAESLFESELFGHKKGSFTDAHEDRIGRFQAAHGGSLFLDEIGNIPLHLQSKLLSVLEQRQVIPVGSNDLVPIDVRIISATNLPPAGLENEAKFRQDLLYRLNTVAITVPPLRDRAEDIPILADHFVAQYARKYDRPPKKISSSAMGALMAYAWPGNVRALKHAVERAMILSENDRLEADDFYLTPRTSMSPAEAADRITQADDTRTLRGIEKETIERVLRKHQGNISRAARELGITRTSLYRRMDKHGL